MAIDGWSPAVVPGILGHGDPRTTPGTYVHLNTKDIPTPSTLVEHADGMWTD